MFNAMNEDGKSSATHHTAEIISYMGPPLAYIQRRAIATDVFDDNGMWN